MKTNKEMIEEAKYEARGIMADYGANKMSYMMEDMDKFITTLLTKHEEAVVERIKNRATTIYTDYGDSMLVVLLEDIKALTPDPTSDKPEALQAIE